jgi:uncharacterized protein YecE (DUF72 family)
MLFLAGTSGFSYPEWRGKFYEAGLAESKMLAAYAAKLPTVEINNTFYRMPKPSLFEGWANNTPETFAFAIKAPRRITHIARLREVEAPVAALFDAAGRLGGKLGPVLFQLPPFLRKDVPLLQAFAACLPKPSRVALEFRHASWFDDDVYQALADAGIALCGSEVEEGDGVSAPFVRTADFGYFRLRLESYTDEGLKSAFDRIAGLGVERAYVYMKHEVLGPEYALALIGLADRRR